MLADCELPIWMRDDFTTCFRRDFLQTLFPLITCGTSCVFLVIQLIQRTVKIKSSPGYDPSDTKLSGADELIDEDEDLDLVLQRKATQTSEGALEVSRPKGEVVFVVVEIVALLGEIGISLAVLLTHSLGRNGDVAAIAGLSTWSYITILACLRLLRMNGRSHVLPNLWNHTAILYIFQFLFTCILFRSAIIHSAPSRTRALIIAEFTLALVLTLIALTTRKGNRAVALEYEDDLEPSHEPLASLFSLATFSWADAIVWKGYWNTFELNDVWNLMPMEKAANVTANFRRLKKTTRLVWHLMKYFKQDLLIQMIWAVIEALLTFAPPLLLQAILRYVENPESVSANTAWLYVILLAVSGCVAGVADGQALWIGRKICIRIRAILVGEIYAKTLRRKAATSSDTVLGQDKDKPSEATSQPKSGFMAKLKVFGRKKKASEPNKAPNEAKTPDSQVNTGTIINLMSVDASKVSEICAYLHFLFPATPVQLVVAVTLLYRLLGYSSFAGLAVMVVLMPVNIWVASRFSVVAKAVMGATDARIHSTNEVLQNIRIIKYFAWEQRFGDIVNNKRIVELCQMRNRFLLWIGATFIWYGAPLLITALSFFFYTVVEKKKLVPSVAFTALSLFNLLRNPLDRIADMIAHVQEAYVSVGRIEEFLNEDETEKFAQLSESRQDENGQTILGFDHATFTWAGNNAQDENQTQAFRMIDLDVRFKVGRLNIIAGPTGSGKTSLLMALLGEMTLIQGKVHFPGGQCREDLVPDPESGLIEGVAYCSQQAWLVNDTIKQNILFSSPWDENRYDSVIEACALGRDLAVLDAGDSTLVGEKGIVVSGGQKQRISLARALYCNSKHVLLDDCLSAVDSHTAQHIFENCIQGPLMLNRTCILVTHNVSLCVPLSHYVVLLANGKIIAQGSPEALISSGALGEDLMKSRPTSKSGTQPPSQSQSIVDLQAVVGPDDTDVKVNGHVTELKVQDKDKITDLGVEKKAEGSVKWKVIKTYMNSMGPWYFWVSILIAYTCESLTSVSTNLWIRQWANSFQTEESNILGVYQRPPQVVDISRIDISRISSSSFVNTLWIGLPLLNSSSPADVSLLSSEIKTNAYYIGIYIVLGLVYLFVAVFRLTIAFSGSLTASRTLHARLLEAVTRAKLRFFDTTPLGQITNRFSKDLQTIDGEVAFVACGALQSLFNMCTIIVLISVITPGFLIAGAFLSFVYFCIGMFYIRSSRDLKRLESVQRSPLYQQFGETLTGITTIRAYGDERRFVRNNTTLVNSFNRPFIYLWATNRWLALRVDWAGALVAFFAALLVVVNAGKIDSGAAGLSLTYAVLFNENVLWLVRLYSQNEQNMNSVERIKEFIDIEQEAKALIPENKPGGNWPSHGAVQFVDYTTRYRSDLDPVLRNLSFSIKAEEKVGIVGRTGAGKSSLALALFRGLEADSGKILIDDVDITLIGLQDLRESITIVPQDPTLFTGTIRTNLDPFGLFTDEEIFTALRSVHLLGASAPGSTTSSPVDDDNSTMPTSPESSSSSVKDSNAKVDLTKVLSNTRENANIFLDLSSSISESGSNLSQGQRQLLCLARALLKAPRVLVMDEATASIDYATDAKIQDTLRELKGNTIITIAHRLQTIIDYDKVLVLDKGELVEFAAPWDLIKKENGIFKGMCEKSGDFGKLVEGARKAEEKGKLVDI